MCFPAALGALGGLGAGAAAGATAAAATAGAGVLSTIGTIVSVGGSLYQAYSGAKAAAEQQSLIEGQKQTEAQLNAVEDQRRRQEFMAAQGQQRAELAARGVSLDSPTAIALGRTVAQEMSFDSQAIRAGGEATQRELTGAQKMAKAQGLSSMLRGTFSAAGTLLNAAPDLWPGFMREEGAYA